MYRIKILPLRPKHSSAEVTKASVSFLHQLFDNTDITYEIVDNISALYDNCLSLILIESDGVLNELWDLLPRLNFPTFILPVNTNSALSAAMEVNSFLATKNMKLHVLLGSNEQILEEIRTFIGLLFQEVNSKIGVIVGTESYKLVSYNINYMALVKSFGVGLSVIENTEFIKIYNSLQPMTMPAGFFNIELDFFELDKSYRFYLTLKKLIKKYHLNAISIDCFSVLDTVKASACLAYDKLEKEGYVTACHNNVWAALGKLICHRLFNEPFFQGDVTGIDFDKQTMTLSKDYVNTSMCESYHADTGSRVKIGVTINGKMKSGLVTIFQISSTLDTYFIETAEIVAHDDNLPGKDRTTIVISGDKFNFTVQQKISSPFLVIYGDKTKQLTQYFDNHGMIPIEKFVWTPMISSIEVSPEKIKLLKMPGRDVLISAYYRDIANIELGETLYLINSTDQNDILKLKIMDAKPYATVDELLSAFDVERFGYGKLPLDVLKEKIQKEFIFGGGKEKLVALVYKIV
mgnify:CR=1 FL=1